jgi:uncharacterized protein YjiS (DUF1127 family)
MVRAAQREIRRVWRAKHWLIDAPRKVFVHHLAARKRLHELRELSAMNDLQLKDIGISRLEIRAAMRSREKRLSRRN